MASSMSIVRSILLLLAMLAVVAAQRAASPTPASASKTATTSAGSATHTIKVGPREDPHQYYPHSVKADVGDTIVFEFYPRNHSIVKADYMAPCVPAVGEYFYSGMFNNFNEDEDNGELNGPAPTWSVTVNDTEPAFFYCTALESCNVNGMVGVINPNEAMTWHSQHEKAKKYPYQVVPGNAPPTEGTEDGSSSTNTSQGSPSGGQSHLSGGAIAGIVIGVLVFVAILVVFFFALGRNRVYQQWMSSQDGRTERTESTARWALFNNNPSIGPSWSTRKSEIDPGIQPIADHPATHISSPDSTHCAVSPPMGMHNSYMSMSGSPPPQQGQGIVGLWNWDMFGPQQQQQQSQLLPRPMPIELESNSRK